MSFCAPTGWLHCGIPATGHRKVTVDTLETMAIAVIFSVNCLVKATCAAAMWRPGKRRKMAVRGLSVVLFGIAVVLGGCMQSTVEPASEAIWTPRDRKLLAASCRTKKRRYLSRTSATSSTITAGKRPAAIADRFETASYLYYVLPSGKAIRYGVSRWRGSDGIVQAWPRSAA